MMTSPPYARARSTCAPSPDIDGVDAHPDAGRGIRHTHIRNDAEDQFILVGFPVVHTDNSGVYHALEHLLFTSASRFLPAGQSLFHYLRLLGATWVNGFTNEDSVYFMVAAKDARPLREMLKLMLASLFTPTLDRTDFRRELFSVAPEPAAGVLDGVILNEMRGVLGSPIRQVWHAVKKHLYSGAPSAFNSGGNIGPLYQLDLARIHCAHSRTFTPQNCFVLSTGPGDGAHYRGTLEEALELCGAMDGASRPHTKVEASVFPTSQVPLVVTETHTGGEKYYYNVSWRIAHAETPTARFAFETLAYIILGNLHAPLRQGLDALPYVTAITGLTGFRGALAGSYFVVTIECKEQLPCGTFASDLHVLLTRLHQQGFDARDIASAIDKIQLRRDEFHESGLPFGAAALAVHFLEEIRGQGIAGPAATYAAIADLREHLTPEHCLDLLRSLIDHPPALQLEVLPTMNAQEPAWDINRVDAVADKGAGDRPSREDTLPAAQHFPAAEPQAIFEDLPGARLYVEQTRSVVHFLSFRNAAVLTQTQLDLIPIYVTVVTELGTGETDQASCQQIQAQVCHQFQAAPCVVGLGDTQISVRVQFYSKLLAMRARAFFSVLGHYMDGVRFDDEAALVFLIEKLARDRLTALRGNGIGFVLAQADSRNCLAAAVQNRISGLESYVHLLRFKQRVTQGEYGPVAAALSELHAQFGKTGPALLVADAAFKDDVGEAFVDVFGDVGTSAPCAATGVDWNYGQAPVREHWIADVAASSCAISFRVPRSGREAEGLAMIATILSDEYVFAVLRERGGAYHVGARLDRQAGSLQFFSNRTRSISDDLNRMLAGIDWFMSNDDLQGSIHRASLAQKRIGVGLRAVPASAIAHFSSLLHPGIHTASEEAPSTQFTPFELRSLVERYLCVEAFNCVVVARESDEMRQVRDTYELDIRRIEH